MTRITIEEAASLLKEEGHSISSMLALLVSLLTAEKNEVRKVLEDHESSRGERALAFTVLERVPANEENMAAIIEIFKSKF